MSDNDISGVLRRKASVGRQQHEARAMPPAKALRLSVSRAAEKLWGLPVRIQGIHQEIVGQEEFLESLDDSMLLLLTDGPLGAMGAVAMDQQTVAALVEVQTMGKVLRARAAERQPTRTDASVSEPLVNEMLQGLSINLAEDRNGWWADGFRYGDMVEDVRTLGLILTAPEMQVFRMSIDFDSGAKEGELTLALPVREKPEKVERPPTGKPKADFGAEFENVEAELDVVLATLPMTLAQAERLAPGMVLELPPDALSRVRLCTRGTCPRMVGQLGQVNGFRALKLNAGPGLAPAAASKSPGGGAAAGSGAVPALDFDGGGSGDLPQLPPMDSQPDMGDGGGDFGGFDTGMEDLPDLPPLDDLPDLPPMEDLPDLPPLDDLPDFPDLPALNFDDDDPLSKLMGD
ncbi:FliM/FliN family flagellar motor C-terminal domain-containing protein [Mesobacterium pallidum]|uniref:FliM/FliN family flagellar motor C-terminal domain-containing protein n=1 Tax=Mesobacterium pallidum TaxID=2872037 RepID=UPI001EE29D76|nr:flagellar motor switch protein FliM [Mesobacterium pallidum]